jgi:hypothetical protein
MNAAMMAKPPFHWGTYTTRRKGKIMFLPYHFASLLNPHTLQFSMQLASALAVERELQDRRRREQLEKSENEKKNTPAPCSY